jgi:putative transposase
MLSMTVRARAQRRTPAPSVGDESPGRPVRPLASGVSRLDELAYPFHDTTIIVTHCGRICFKGQKVNLSHAFAGQAVGVTQVNERIWLVTFMQYDLGYFDDETCRLEPIENPFGAKLLPVRSE